MRPVGLGVGVPGPVDFDRGCPVSPPIMPGWDRYPVRDALSTALGLPAVVDNDVNLMALGEMHAGVARTLDSFLFVKIGTGIGCGIVMHGELYRGVEARRRDREYPRGATGPTCACGNVGCLRRISGAPHWLDGAEAAHSGRWRCFAARARRQASSPPPEVARAAAAGDGSRRTLRPCGHRLGWCSQPGDISNPRSWSSGARLPNGQSCWPRCAVWSTSGRCPRKTRRSSQRDEWPRWRRRGGAAGVWLGHGRQLRTLTCKSLA